MMISVKVCVSTLAQPGLDGIAHLQRLNRCGGTLNTGLVSTGRFGRSSLAPGGARVGEVEVRHGDRVDAIPRGVVDDAGDRVPHLGIAGCPLGSAVGEQHRLAGQHVTAMPGVGQMLGEFR